MNPKENNLPVRRNPWEVVDYASARGEITTDNNIEVLQHLELIDCGLGDSPFGPPEILQETLQSFSNSGQLSEAIWKYPPDKFCEAPSKLVRERYGLSDKPIITFHSEGSYGLLAQIILELPDITVEEEVGILGIGPQFPNIVSLTLKHGLDNNNNPRFPYISAKPDISLTMTEKIEHLISERENNNNGRRFIYIDNPNNPTGDFAPIAHIEHLAQQCNKHNDVLIVDEAYGDVLPDNESSILLTEKYDNIIAIRGIAKVLGMAGARCGYAVMSPTIGETYQSLQLVFGVDGIKQLILNEVLKPEIIKSHIDKVKQQIEPIKNYMVEGLNNLGIWIAPTHHSVPIMLAKGPERFFQYLKRYQIVSERGSDFRETYPLDDSFVRLRVPGSIDEVSKVLQRVEQLLTEISQ